MKTFIHFIACFCAVFALSACSHDSNSEYKFEEQTYYRILDSHAQVTFARSTLNCTLNPDDKTIQISTSISQNGSNITIESNSMSYTAVSANTYRFAGNAKASGHDVADFTGLYDVATNAVYIEMTLDGQYRTYITSIPLFPYSTTTVKLADNTAEPLELDNAIDGVAFDTTLKDGLFAIMNFQLSSIESPVSEIDYKGVTVKPTTVGYEITADILTPSSTYNLDKYTITDVIINIGEQGRAINGSYKCGNYEVVFSGRTFNKE